MELQDSSEFFLQNSEFQNASIEIKQISVVYQQNRFSVKKLICKMQSENSFTDKGFFYSKEIL